MSIGLDRAAESRPTNRLEADAAFSVAAQPARRLCDSGYVATAEDGSVKGRFHNDHGREYEFIGSVSEDRFFTGHWRQTSRGVGGYWHGVFHYRILDLDQGEKVLGLWVGISTNENRFNWGGCSGRR